MVHFEYGLGGLITINVWIALERISVYIPVIRGWLKHLRVRNSVFCEK